MSGRQAAHHEHGDSRPSRPALGEARQPQSTVPGPVILDVTAFYDKWKKSANKIVQRMQDNLEATMALITGGGRR